MSQTTLTSYFNSRKRAATEEISSSKNKIPHIERVQDARALKKALLLKKSEVITKDVTPNTELSNGINLDRVKKTEKSFVSIVTKDGESESQPKKTVFARKHNVSNIAKSVEPIKTTTVHTARQELSLGDIRKRLAGSSRLAELRASAERISKGIQQVKEITKKPNLKEFKSIDVEVPLR